MSKPKSETKTKPSALVKIAQMPYFISEYSELDIQRATKIAESFIARIKLPQQVVATRQLIHSYLELWKLEKGEARKYGAGFIPKLIVDEEERFEIIDPLKPWECAPYGVGRNPLDLWVHLWASDYKDVRSHFLDGLAILIKDSADQADPALTPAIVKASLRLYELWTDTLEHTSKSLWKNARAKAKQNSYLAQATADSVKVRQERKAALQNQIHGLANQYLAQKKRKSTIGGLIFKHGGITNSKGQPMTIRNIHNYLKTHPTWGKATK